MIAFRYTALGHGVLLCYLPFGIGLMHKMAKGDKLYIRESRKETAQLCATDKFFAACTNAHNNLLETYPFFAAAVLGGLQAGVPKSQVLCRVNCSQSAVHEFCAGRSPCQRVPRCTRSIHFLLLDAAFQ